MTTTASVEPPFKRLRYVWLGTCSDAYPGNEGEALAATLSRNLKDVSINGEVSTAALENVVQRSLDSHPSLRSEKFERQLRRDLYDWADDDEFHAKSRADVNVLEMLEHAGAECEAMYAMGFDRLPPRLDPFVQIASDSGHREPGGQSITGAADENPSWKLRSEGELGSQEVRSAGWIVRHSARRIALIDKEEARLELTAVTVALKSLYEITAVAAALGVQIPSE